MINNFIEASLFFIVFIIIHIASMILVPAQAMEHSGIFATAFLAGFIGSVVSPYVLVK